MFRILIVTAGLAAMTTVAAAEVLTRPPAQAVVGFPDRVAVLITAPNPAQPARGVRAAQDVETVGKRLTELGFTAVFINAANRPDLDRQLRDAAATVSQGADLSVMAFGRFVSDDDEIWIVPGDAPSDVESRPETLPTEALRMSDALRRLGRGGPRTMAVIVDECAVLKAAGCAVNAVARAAGSSADLGIIATSRVTAPPSDGRPLAARPSAADAILQSMTVEGKDFLEFFSRFQTTLSGGNLSAVPTVALSNTFAFWPQGLFEKMQIPCNRITADVDLDKLRESDPAPLVESCRSATATWPYVPTFSANLAVATEQAAVKASVRSCADAAKARDYLTTYPAGRWRQPVQAFLAACEAEDRAITAGRRREAVDRIVVEIERLVQSNATSQDLRTAGLKALDLDAGSAAFRAFNEIDARTDEEAAWRMGQFYDPTVSDKVLRATVPRPDAARAGWYYNAWRASPRHREALERLCREKTDAQARDERFRDFCR